MHKLDIGQFLHVLDIYPQTEMKPVAQEIDEAMKVSKLTGLLLIHVI